MTLFDLLEMFYTKDFVMDYLKLSLEEVNDLIDKTELRIYDLQFTKLISRSSLFNYNLRLINPAVEKDSDPNHEDMIIYVKYIVKNLKSQEFEFDFSALLF